MLGTLELQQAALVISGTVQVLGDATFASGRLAGFSGATLDLDGEAWFIGASVVEDGPDERVVAEQQMTVEVQGNARNCVSMIVQELRSAGWNPLNAGGIPAVVTDQDLSDSISEIEIFADLDEDGFS